MYLPKQGTELCFGLRTCDAPGRGAGDRNRRRFRDQRPYRYRLDGVLDVHVSIHTQRVCILSSPLDHTLLQKLESGKYRETRVRIPSNIPRWG